MAASSANGGRGRPRRAGSDWLLPRLEDKAPASRMGRSIRRTSQCGRARLRRDLGDRWLERGVRSRRRRRCAFFSVAQEDELTFSTADHPRARFTPIIDSRKPASGSLSQASPPGNDSPPDEGSFETISNGDVLERGEMENPETGRPAAYEEVWRRLPLLRDGGPSRTLILESTEDNTVGKAFIGRVGNYELGMVDGKDGFGVVRRERQGGIWRMVCANGAGRLLPTPHEGEEYLEGAVVQLAGRPWRVLEST